MSCKMEDYFCDDVRKLGLTMIFHAGSGHPGGVLSCADLIATLVFGSQKILDENENRLILSKGHSVPALYAASMLYGLESFELLADFRAINGRLQGHPHVKTTPWLNASTGSLGQGFSVSVGLALGKRHLGDNGNVFAILGDGELQEGQVWEAAMSAGHFKLNNLCAIVDYNKLQSDDWNENIMALSSLREKWVAFNWNVIEIDGHDINQIEDAINKFVTEKERPTVIVANTIKGKGVSFMENVPTWHGSVTMSEVQIRDSLSELGSSESQISALLNGQYTGGENV